MASSHGTNRVTTRHDLCNNPRLIFVAPLPPTTGSREDFQPPDRLRDSTMHCVHSKPNGENQTEDSQISTSSGRRPQNTAYTSAVGVRLHFGLDWRRLQKPVLSD